MFEMVMFKENDLLSSLDKIHTTELGVLRLKRNLELETDDVIKWCVRKIKQADKIVRKGKNWYVYAGDVVLTVNAGSYTVITGRRGGE